jgi:hypothetical protein
MPVNAFPFHSDSDSFRVLAELNETDTQGFPHFDLDLGIKYQVQNHLLPCEPIFFY